MNNKSFCGNCGAELNQDDVFCAGCGCAVTAEQTQDSQQYFADNTAAAQPVYVTGAGTAAKKISNKMIGIIICAAVVLIAVIGIIIAVCVNSSDASDLLGTWKDPSDGDIVAAFNDNGIMYWDKYLMYYELTGDGEITVSSVIYCTDIYNVEDFLEYSAKDYISDQLKKNSYLIDEGTLYYKFVEGDMYDRLYIADSRDDLEDCIIDDEYLTSVK